LSDPNQADLRVIDGFNPNEPLLEFFRREGVTIIHAMPGRMNVIGGQTGIFRTFGPTLDKATIRFPAAVLVNLGESPKDAYRSKGPPATRMATAKIIREALTGSQQYAARLRDPEASQKLTRNLKAEGLIPLVKGDIPLIISAHRADDISTGLRLAKEFKLKAMLSLASEGYLITDAIADAKVPVIVHPSMQRIGANLETMNTLTINAAILAEKKIPVSISTAFEGYVPKTRVLRAEMAMAATHGLGTERALRAVTLDAAKILGIDQQYGSIEVGKVADLVLYDGDPFENATHVKYTIMEGRIVYDRLDYLKLPFERRAIPLHGSGIGCCLGQW
jgi:imidazolonepropionase-like amidohydrolase